MNERFIYSRNKGLWKGRECSHPGCTAFAVTQCDGFNGNALDGNICAAPLCEFHRHAIQGMDFCDRHNPHIARPAAAEVLPQLSLLDFA